MPDLSPCCGFLSRTGNIGLSVCLLFFTLFLSPACEDEEKNDFVPMCRRWCDEMLACDKTGLYGQSGHDACLQSCEIGGLQGSHWTFNEESIACVDQTSTCSEFTECVCSHTDVCPKSDGDADAS